MAFQQRLGRRCCRNRICYLYSFSHPPRFHPNGIDLELLCLPYPWRIQTLGIYASARARRNRERRAKANLVQSFESLIHTQKPFKRLWNIKRILAKHPMQAMSVRELERSLESAGILKCPKLVDLLEKYPALFKVSEGNGLNYPVVEFAEEGKELLQEEQLITQWYEPHLVLKVRKLLMMSVHRTLRLDHFCLLQQELALPDDFEERIAHSYPDFFTVVEGDDGPYLELTAWDDSLAVTAREQHLQDNPLFDKRKKPLPFGFPIFLPKGHRLGMKNTEALNAWQKTPFASPYEDPAWVDPMSVAAGKRSVAALHEFLSVTVEKRTTVEHLDMLRKDWKIPGRLPAFLDKHFGIFYLSHRDNRNHVFLEEAYRALSHQKKVAYLNDKGPHVLLNEMFCKLMEVRRP